MSGNCRAEEEWFGGELKFPAEGVVEDGNSDKTRDYYSSPAKVGVK